MSVLLAAIVIGLLLTPFIFPGAQALAVAAKILVFIVLVASFDLLLGYTGIASFAHTMFFGIGAYGVAIACTRIAPTWGAIAIGILAALALSLVISTVIGLVSLRVRAMFYAMITLAMASAFQTLAGQLRDLTGAGDGLTFSLPRLLSPAFRLSEEPVLGVVLNGRIISYYLLFFSAVIFFLALLRIVNSTFGRVLQAIRENDFRVEAIGFRVVIYRTASNVLAALFATLAGAMFAIWLGYNGPSTTLSFEVMVNILLMLVIGGMGTMYGAIIGATLFLIAENYLHAVMEYTSHALSNVPFLAALFSPERWLLWLGVLFVLSVYFFPSGIVGRLRESSDAKRSARMWRAPPVRAGSVENAK